MNVFVLCTGRCGSKTFSKACGEIKNYTSGHETRSGFIGFNRTNYPRDHIEIDNRLSWFLGRLDKIYGDAAVYVHLTRFSEKVVRSYTRRYRNGIIMSYYGSNNNGILLGVDKNNYRKSDIVRDYVHTVDSNIEFFLKDKTKKMNFDIAKANELFPEFCKLINAEVDMDKALEHFNTRYNESKYFARLRQERENERTINNNTSEK